MANAVAVGLVLVSAAAHAMRNFLTKRAHDKEIFVLWYQITGIGFLLPFFLYFWWQNPIEGGFALFLGLVSAVVHALYWIFHARALEKGDLSHVYPIMRSAPALILILAILFLDEVPSVLGIIGIILSVIGVYIINCKRADIFRPFAHLRNAAFGFALLGMLSIVAYSLIDKIAVQHVHPVVLAFLIYAAGTLFFAPYVLRVKGRSAVREGWLDHKKSALVAGLINVGGYALILIAFTLEKVSYVVGLRQLSIIFAVLLGGHVLRERNRMMRMVAALVLFTGVFLIAVAE